MDGALDALVISRENSSHEMYLIVYIAITIMKGDLCAVRCVTSCFITLFAQPQATAFLVTLEPKYKVMPVPHNPKDVPNTPGPIKDQFRISETGILYDAPTLCVALRWRSQFLNSPHDSPATPLPSPWRAARP